MGIRTDAGKTFCEFFAGVGLVREGLIPSGWTCAYANDLDPAKRDLYLGRFGDEGHFHLSDVWDTAAALERIPGAPFLATASFPCVDLSLAGVGRGFEGERSATFFGFAKTLDALGDRRPKLVLLENVTGFVTSRGGKDFEAAALALAGLGYRLDAFVLDAVSFVPQSRPRVFVVGMADGVRPPGTEEKPGLDWVAGGWDEVVTAAPPGLRPARLVDLMRRIELPTGWTALRLPRPGPARNDLAGLVDLDDGQEWWDREAVAKHLDMTHDRHRVKLEQMLADNVDFVGTIFRRKRDGRTRAEVRFDGAAGCLRTPKGGSARQIVVAVSGGGLRMRWMSPREYARLQGAPEYPLSGRVTRDLHAFGDAVCVPAVAWIDRNVLTPAYEAAAALKRA